jgi:hypothetical protein
VRAKRHLLAPIPKSPPPKNTTQHTHHTPPTDAPPPPPKKVADAHAGGRVVALHEGGYSDLYVPFCGLAAVEGLAGVRSKVF